MNSFFKTNAFLAFGFLCVGMLLYFLFASTPPTYPKGGVITIPEGTSIQEAGELLYQKHIVRSPFVFSVLARVMNSESGVIANTYSLAEKENVVLLAYRFTHGETGLSPVKITIPEGLSVREIAEVLESKLAPFDTARFLQIARQEEGYLFPETYFFLPGTSPEVVLQTMRSTFDEKIRPFERAIQTSGKSVEDIVIMASILEREARKLETRKVISGILWKRIQIGMGLQVDAVFGYILDTSGYAPTLEDYKIESPYNTYLHRGLPPGAISNPGLEAIEAALYPSETKYLYYLTGDDGNMYYARTFAEHVANRKYLK